MSADRPHTERPDERSAWDEADDRRCAEFLGRGRCALVAGHAGSHAPLLVLWQEAGYEDGEWSEFALLASLERVEAERDRLVEALKRIVDHGKTHEEPCWALHNGDCADVFQEIARSALASLDRDSGEEPRG